MERDDLAPADTLAAHDGVTRHIMVGFYDPAVRSLPPERDEAARGHLPLAPRLAFGRRVRGRKRTCQPLLGISVMLPALFGAVLVHYPHVLAQPSVSLD
jgi:hypothetical protein